MVPDASVFPLRAAVVAFRVFGAETESRGQAVGTGQCSWDRLPPASAAPREGRSEAGGALGRGLSETPFCTWTWEQDASVPVRPPTWLRGPFRGEL